eukprot:1195089-Prorocentrum_minimum.AAC.2
MPRRRPADRVGGKRVKRRRSWPACSSRLCRVEFGGGDMMCESTNVRTDFEVTFEILTSTTERVSREGG